MTERPPLKVLRFVADMQPWHVELLKRFAESDVEGPSFEELIDLRNHGHVGLWEVSRTLIITKIVEWNAGREFFVWGVEGSGMLRHIDAICDDMKVIAREFRCKSIGGNVMRKGLERFYLRLGGKPVYTYYSMELEADG